MTDALSKNELEAALAAATMLGGAHVLAGETLALPRVHGRVLARPLVMDAHSVLESGCVLTPARVALVASRGIASLEVMRRPTVALFTIGDHLVPPGMPRAEGQAYDAVRELLMGLLRADGLEPTAWPRLPEDPTQVEIALRDAGCAFDLIIVCAPAGARGVGTVAQVLERFGRITADGVPAQRHATPLLGRLDEACVLALPDDVSTVLGLYVSIGRALIDGLQGRAEPRMLLRARLCAPDRVGNGADPWQPVRLVQDDTGRWCAEPVKGNPALANAIVHRPPTNADEPVPVWPI